MKPWPVFRGSSHLRRGLSAGSHAPRCPWFTHSLAPPPAPGLSPALCPDAALTTKPPSVQSPFARFWRYLHRGDVRRLLGRHCSSVLAHTDPCADPDWLSPTSVLPRLKSLCRLLPAPAATRIFPTLSLLVIPEMPGPLPRRLAGCIYLLLPLQHRPSPKELWVGVP